MGKSTLNMSELEKEIAEVETDALVEEQFNANQNYGFLEAELKDITSKIPFPDIEGRYGSGVDYEDRDGIQYKKSCNEPFWKRRDEIKKYCQKGNLYIGHLNLNGNDYYFMESGLLDTKSIKNEPHGVRLINVDDDCWRNYTNLWRFPNEDDDVNFSRNIIMQNRKISSVDILRDKGNEFFSSISDAYLRKALIRNKSQTTAQSIIQTIQKKQDTIRSLPKDRSFVVQGCAGSGKTMVLLHRLRYLLYNKQIENDNYVFLVPSHGFKMFIDDFSNKFNITKTNILTYQEYYQQVLGKKQKHTSTDAGELVFDAEYLKKIYSHAFMQQAYNGMFDVFSKQTEAVVSFCETKFNELLEREFLLLKTAIENVKNGAVQSALDIVKEIQGYISTQIEDDFDNIQPLIEEIEQAYIQRRQEYEKIIDPNLSINILPDDPRILSNENLIEIQKSIDAECLAVEKASVFTVLSHKNKLKKLQESYAIAREELVGILIEEDKAKYAQQASQLVFVYPNLSFEDAEDLLIALKSLVKVANSDINKVKNNLEGIKEYLGEKFSAEIDNLNKLITASGEITNRQKECVQKLLPAYAFFEEIISLGTELINALNRYGAAEAEFVQTEAPLFVARTQNQLYAYLNLILVNACKKKIVQEYETKICDAYKHYWYINLYCHYLTRPMKQNEKKFIFIDEAQDLSIAEIELINKINTTVKRPTINLFGDVNQMITNHGIQDWSKLQIIPDTYILDENFRNTNQIVDFCNENLMMQMVKIGVDMDPVSEYNTINDAIRQSTGIAKNAVFIVKDDYSVFDLRALLDQTDVTDYEIYTVKAVKGLEFKEIFVFDTDMSQNEKYISYTRALIKLNVIKSLPQTIDRGTRLIVEDNESEEESVE